MLVDSTDFMWDYAPISYWTCVEINGAIIIPCLILLKPLFRKLLPKFFSTDHESLSDIENPSGADSPSSRFGARRFGWFTSSRNAEVTVKDELGMASIETQSK